MPIIDSLKAYEESYLFRAAIEPTGIRPREPRRRDARDHLAILAAIEAQDLAGAAALIKEHIESGRHDTAHTRNAFSG
jgi:DNA-binding GntR family transcriptional regulator